MSLNSCILATFSHDCDIKHTCSENEKILRTITVVRKPYLRNRYATGTCMHATSTVAAYYTSTWNDLPTMPLQQC